MNLSSFPRYEMVIITLSCNFLPVLSACLPGGPMGSVSLSASEKMTRVIKYFATGGWPDHGVTGHLHQVFRHAGRLGPWCCRGYFGLYATSGCYPYNLPAFSIIPS